MPLISHLTCHAMPIGRQRVRAGSCEMHSRVIHEFTRYRDFSVGRPILAAAAIQAATPAESRLRAKLPAPQD